MHDANYVNQYRLPFDYFVCEFEFIKILINSTIFNYIVENNEMTIKIKNKILFFI